GLPSGLAIGFKAHSTSVDALVFQMGIFTVVPFATVDFDDGSNYNPLTGTYTVPSAGVYHFDVNLSINAPTQIIIAIYAGANPVAGNQIVVPSMIIPLAISADVKLNAQDEVQVVAFAFGSNVALLGQGGLLNTFSGHKVY